MLFSGHLQVLRAVGRFEDCRQVHRAMTAVVRTEPDSGAGGHWLSCPGADQPSLGEEVISDAVKFVVPRKDVL